MPFEQENLPIRLKAPFEKGVMLVNQLAAEEQVSGLYKLEVDVLIGDRPLEFKDVLGQPVTIELGEQPDVYREFSGIVSRVVDLPDSAGSVRHRLEIVPWLWLLTLKTNCRIFQEKTVPEIVEQVLGELAVADFEFRGLGHQEPRLFCVQYRESDFNFISRLLEQAGIFFFFEHKDGAHRMILVDSASVLETQPPLQDVLYMPHGSIDVIKPHVSSFQYDQSLRPGKHALNDFHFLDPGTAMLTQVNSGLGLDCIENLEVYDYPGGYVKQGAEDAGKLGLGDAEVFLRKEESDARSIQVSGKSDVCQLVPGSLFTLSDHPHEGYNTQYLILTVTHRVEQALELSGGGASDTRYHNVFTCIPDTVVYRPLPRTPKPRVQGPQTAIVVGPDGEEIYIDKHGRVKVQFHWDREGKANETSSCWIRVSQNWAGKNWGGFFHPRIGQEVIVDFLEGDPDRPIITGRVYNAEQPLPYPNASWTGIKSRSTPDGEVDDCNEIRFEDKAGGEELFVQAQKDQKILVKANRSASIGMDDSQTIGRDKDLEVGRNRGDSIGGDDEQRVSGDHSVDVGGKEKISVGQEQSLAVGGDQEVSLGSDRQLSISSDDTQSVGGKRTTSVSGNDNLSVGGNYSVDSGGNTTLKVGKSLTIEAGDQITIKVGSAKFLLKKDGTIKVDGKDLTFKGSGKIKVQASKDLVLKGSKVQSN